MEKAEDTQVALPGATSDILLLNKRLYRMSYSQQIDQSIAVGCSFYDLDGSRYLTDDMPWQPPVPVEFFGPIDEVGKNLFQIIMMPSQRQRWEVLTGKLKISMPATLDWCIRCWSEVQTQRLLDRTLVCILPSGERITADFGIFNG